MTESPNFNLILTDNKPLLLVSSDNLTIKHSEDRVGPFTRWEIDRGIPPDMKNESGTPMLQVVIDKLREQGSIAIMDAGCGTARALYQIRDQLLLRTDARPSDILTTGISNIDFSDESEDLNVRNAITKGDINYIVDDIAAAKFKPQSFDTIYSFEAFIYNEPEKVIKMIKNLLPALKPNGFLIFNLKEGQRNTDTIDNYLKASIENGFTTHEYVVDHRRTRRMFVLIRPFLEITQN